MKKLFALTLLSLCLLAVKPVHAAAPNVTTLFSSGTSSTLINAGAGTLFAIHITSGNAGDFAVCYDSNSASGITTTLGGTSTTPELLRVIVSTASGTPGIGAEPASIPIVNFTNGLACIQSASQRTNIYWRQPN